MNEEEKKMILTNLKFIENTDEICYLKCVSTTKDFWQTGQTGQTDVIETRHQEHPSLISLIEEIKKQNER